MLKTSSVSPFSFCQSLYLHPLSALSRQHTDTVTLIKIKKKSEATLLPPPSLLLCLKEYKGHERERVTSILRPPIHNLLFLFSLYNIWYDYDCESHPDPAFLLEITKGLNLFFLGIFCEANLIPDQLSLRISPPLHRQVPFNGYK